MPLKSTVWLALACLPLHAFAETSADAATDKQELPRIEIGATTNALLDLQRSELAAGPLLPMQGELASRAYQRYLEGFRQSPSGNSAAETGVPSRTGSSVGR